MQPTQAPTNLSHDAAKWGRCSATSQSADHEQSTHSSYSCLWDDDACTIGVAMESACVFAAPSCSVTNSLPPLREREREPERERERERERRSSIDSTVQTNSVPMRNTAAPNAAAPRTCRVPADVVSSGGTITCRFAQYGDSPTPASSCIRLRIRRDWSITLPAPACAACS